MGMGLLHHLLGLETYDALLSHPVVGTSWEGFAPEQIPRVWPDITPYFWSTHCGAELDLLFVLNGENIGAEFRCSAMEDPSLDYLFVIHPGQTRFPLHDRVNAIPFAEFIDTIARC